MTAQKRRIAKTLTYCCMHITVATMVAYALSGDLAIALSIGLIEPFVQSFVFYFHETVWESRSVRAQLAESIRKVRLV